MKSRPEDVVARSSNTNTPEVVTKEAMPAELHGQTENITASIKTSDMGAVKLVRPAHEVLVGIGQTLAASGITDYNPDAIAETGVFEADSNNQYSVLILGKDDETLKISYDPPKDKSSPDF